MSGGRQKAAAVGAALIAMVALIGAGCTASTDDDCELGAYALAVAPAGKGGGGKGGGSRSGGGKSGVGKQPPKPGKDAPAGKKPKTRHGDSDCDDW